MRSRFSMWRAAPTWRTAATRLARAMVAAAILTEPTRGKKGRQRPLYATSPRMAIPMSSPSLEFPCGACHAWPKCSISACLDRSDQGQSGSLRRRLGLRKGTRGGPDGSRRPDRPLKAPRGERRHFYASLVKEATTTPRHAARARSSRRLLLLSAPLTYGGVL
jgi:hypothetical protein